VNNGIDTGGPYELRGLYINPSYSIEQVSVYTTGSFDAIMR